MSCFGRDVQKETNLEHRKHRFGIEDLISKNIDVGDR